MHFLGAAACFFLGGGTVWGLGKKGPRHQTEILIPKKKEWPEDHSFVLRISFGSFSRRCRFYRCDFLFRFGFDIDYCLADCFGSFAPFQFLAAVGCFADSALIARPADFEAHQNY